MSAAKWWSAVDPVTVEVSCGEDRHRLSWRRGKLVLEDHDLAAEESFAALGGEPALCLEVLRAWRAGIDDHYVLWLWDAPPKGNIDLSGMIATMRSREQQLLAQPWIRRPPQPGRPGPPGPTGAPAPARRAPPPPRPPAPGRPAPPPPGPSGRAPGPFSLSVRAVGGAGGRVPQPVLDRMRADMASEFRRSLLSALPEELRLRLGLSAIVRAERHLGDRAWVFTRAADLESALAGRARPAFQECMRAWRGRLTHQRLMVECWVARPGEPAAVCGLMDDAGAWAGLRLPPRWLVDVWARGVAVVDGCFVLAVHAAEASGRRLSVTALRWERRLPAGSTPVLEPAVAVRLDDGAWCLRWAG